MQGYLDLGCNIVQERQHVFSLVLVPGARIRPNGRCYQVQAQRSQKHPRAAALSLVSQHCCPAVGCGAADLASPL
jgi:hypothetical protein